MELKLLEPWTVYRLRFKDATQAKAFRQMYYYQVRKKLWPKAKIRVNKDLVTLVRENLDV